MTRMWVILEFWKRWSGWDFLGRCLLRQVLQVMRLSSGLFCAPAEVGGDVVLGKETPALNCVCLGWAPLLLLAVTQAPLPGVSSCPKPHLSN